MILEEFEYGLDYGRKNIYPSMACGLLKSVVNAGKVRDELTSHRGNTSPVYFFIAIEKNRI